MADAFEILGLTSAATPQEVKARWQKLASEHHPDRGGDPDKFHECRQAYKKALEIASRPIICPACFGGGSTITSSGFNTISIVCHTCKGSGVRNEES